LAAMNLTPIGVRFHAELMGIWAGSSSRCSVPETAHFDF
jgi:hypothetical protein